MGGAVSGLSRRITVLLVAAGIALLVGACGEGLSLVAVNADARPLPFKTPRVAEDNPAPEADSAASTTPESESETQPAIETDVEPVVAEGQIEEPTAAPETEPEASPTATNSPVESDSGTVPDPSNPEERAAWRLAVVESSGARLTALRPSEIHPDLLAAGETSDFLAIFGEEIAAGAMASGLESYYAVFSISALPWESDIQFSAPLFFFEQVLVHESPEGAKSFLSGFGSALLDWLLESSINGLNQTMPGILDTESAPEIVDVPLGDSSEVSAVIVHWPTTPGGVGFNPEVYIILISRGDTTMAFAIGNGGEAWSFRFFSVLEAAMARLS